MEKIEIRYNRKKLLVIVLFCAFWVVTTTLIIFTTEPYSTYTIVKIIAAFVNTFIAYVGFLQLKLMIENAPVLTLSQTGIVFNNNGKLSTFLWHEINSLTIEQVRAGNRGKTDILIITSNTATQKIPLASLEKSVAEVKELLGMYRQKTL